MFCTDPGAWVTGHAAPSRKPNPERQIPYDITYMWNLKYDANEHIYETETNSQT